ncbi:putative odorant receptor 92a [Anthonomus grandis grandis]|uniref:putative odorant receptor 92a n=1 Tax=Anthonomus grandis grandis TaxID=2921223 RepID=UPI0021651B47|nr:putative odorant receptor 92a [Anthonomus grandis grandis]
MLPFSPQNEQLISWAKYIMVAAGYWNLPISYNFFINRAFNVYSLIMRSSIFLFWLSLIAELIRLIIYEYEQEIIITSFSVVVNATKIISKIIIFTKNNIQDLYIDVIAKEGEIWKENNKKVIKMYKSKIRTCRFYVVWMVTTTSGTIAFLEYSGGAKVFELIKHNKLYNETLEPHVMYQTIIPLNKLNHVYWLFFTQALWSWVGFVFNSLTHLAFVVLLVYAAAQLERLQIKFRDFIEHDFDDDEGDRELKVKEKITILKTLIREHQYIIGFVQRLNSCVKYVILIEYILASMDMASVSVNLIKMDLNELGWLLSFLLLLMIQLFLLGWTCNELKYQSEQIADALFDSNWYLLNKEANQLTQTIIARAQRPLLMTIGPFGPMTIRSVFLVIRAAYSYVSVMIK